jgi:hypothetical protein
MTSARSSLDFFVSGLLAARVAELPGFQTLGVLLFVFRCGVVAILAVTTLQRNDFPHLLIPF